MRTGAAALGTALFLLTACTGDMLSRLGVEPETSAAQDAPDGLEIGHRLMNQGEYELASAAYSRAAAKQGLNTDTLSALGSASLKLGRLGQANRYLNLAVEQDPKFIPAWNNLGVVLTSQQNYEEAHQAFRAAFALDNGKSEEIWQNLLLALQNLENKKQRTDQAAFRLVRRGNGRFLLLGAPQDGG